MFDGEPYRGAQNRHDRGRGLPAVEMHDGEPNRRTGNMHDRGRVLPSWMHDDQPYLPPSSRSHTQQSDRPIGGSNRGAARPISTSNTSRYHPLAGGALPSIGGSARSVPQVDVHSSGAQLPSVRHVDVHPPSLPHPPARGTNIPARNPRDQPTSPSDNPMLSPVDERRADASPDMFGQGSTARAEGVTTQPSSVAATNGRRDFIEPVGRAGYTPNLPATQYISEIIKFNMEIFYPSWGKIPMTTRRQWFRNWKSKVIWSPEHEGHMWKAFQSHGSTTLSRIYCECKSNGGPKSWMGDEFWAALQRRWQSDEFKRLSESNKKNRSSENGGVVYAGGPISAATHKRKLAKELGREPSLFDVHCKVRKKKGGQWVSKRAARVALDYQNKLADFLSQQDMDDHLAPNQEDLSRLFIEAAGPSKKDRTYGLSFCSEEWNISSPCNAGASQVWETMIQDVARSNVELREQMTQQVGNLRQQMADQIGDLRLEMTHQRNDLTDFQRSFHRSLRSFEETQSTFQRSHEAMFSAITRITNGMQTRCDLLGQTS